MPFLLAKILNFQGSAHLIGVGSLSIQLKMHVNQVHSHDMYIVPPPENHVQYLVIIEKYALNVYFSVLYFLHKR